MSTADGIPTGEELARHARWIRRMAGALLRDEAAAEDLAQDTWLAALTRAPRVDSLRPWLREVARNFARQHHRGKARREAREAVARAPAGPLAPDEYAERLEAEQRLTRELAALEEPFRSSLMLRYYEELEPAEIAARLGLPGGTVRWRLSRGLALLRERLDRAHGGDRRAWSLALAPLARLDGAAGAAAVTAAATVTTAALLPGFLAMNALKLSVAAAALLVLGLSLSGVLPESLTLFARRETPLVVSFRPLVLEAAERLPDELPPAARAAAERSELVPLTEPEEIVAATALEATLDARFVANGRPLAGARLIVVRGDERPDALSGADGLAQRSFALAREREQVRVELEAFGYATQTRTAVCAEGTTTHLGLIELAPGGAVAGRLLDERGQPLGGALVTLGSLDQPFPRLEEARLQPARNLVPAATSDARGHFRLLGVSAGMVRLWAHAEGKMASYSAPLEVRAGQESSGIELVLAPLAAENVLRGIVLDPAGNPVPGAKIAFRHATRGGNSMTSGESRSDADGRFEFRLVPDARSWLRASDPEGRWNPGSLSDLANGPSEHVLQLCEAREVELVVQDRARTPLASFAVELRGVDDSADMDELIEEFGPERAAELVTQRAPRLGGLPQAEHAGGRAQVALPDEPFFLRVLAPGHRVFQRGPLDPERVEATLTCTLEPVPGLAGVVLRGGEPLAGVRVELRAEVENDTEVVLNGYRVRVHPDVLDETRSDDEGRFLLTARAPGSYVVRAEPATGAPAELGPLVVDANLGGPPLELRLGTGGAIEGRVELASGADPEGAIVGISRGDGGERTQRVASDGRFRFEALLPGPWRVELRSEELFGPQSSMMSNQGPSVRPFELDANCTVVEGQTTFVDVSDATPEGFVFEGRLTLDERAAVGWTAKLGPVGSLEIDGEGWQPLDSDGRFRLSVRAPGDYRLTLRLLGGEFQEQLLFEDLTLEGGEAPWERALHTGKLRLVGLGAWSGEGPPPVVFFWKGPGQFFGLAVLVGDGEHALSVPSGNAELRAPGKSMDPDTWRVLRSITVPRGAELRVELGPDELTGG